MWSWIVWPTFRKQHLGDFRDTVERLRGVIRDSARARPAGITARKYLLPGFLVCEVEGCGRKLRSRPRGSTRGDVWRRRTALSR
ncbi:hypothetical protein GCM10027265_38760 [Jatrophihabitans fulvus]